jgi:Tfp pilus assembly protein PilN
MSNNASFLPEDYLAQKIERRTNVVSLILFAIVMAGVAFAFLFTTQKWKQVKSDQAAINARYEQAAEDIRDLTELEAQKEQMLDKAELAAALVERVPRSILMAELINRMPDRLSLLELELKSEKMKKRVARVVDTDAKTGRLKPKRPKTKQEATEAAKVIEAPTYLVSITLMGVAPGDLEVSRFLTQLNAYPLLMDVKLKYTKQKLIDGEEMREFKMTMRLNEDADIRDVDPMVLHRDVLSPLTKDLQMPSPEALREKLAVEQNEEE